MDLDLGNWARPAEANAEATEAAKLLGGLLRQTPEHEAYSNSLKAMTDDSGVARVTREARSHWSAYQLGGDGGQRAGEMMRLELELEDNPLVRACRLAEQDVRELLRAVDEIVSQEAGIEFAANAQRTGGCCGR
jgi:cell fate (sporulation/competence/biofilm development) regulator YlbF (YheA/YmcA/DUF963 family)